MGALEDGRDAQVDLLQDAGGFVGNHQDVRRVGALEFCRVVGGGKTDRKMIGAELPLVGLQQFSPNWVAASPGLGFEAADLAPEDFRNLAFRRRGGDHDAGAVGAQKPDRDACSEEGLSAGIRARNRNSGMRDDRLHYLGLLIPRFLSASVFEPFRLLRIDHLVAGEAHRQRDRGTVFAADIYLHRRGIQDFRLEPQHADGRFDRFRIASFDRGLQREEKLLEPVCDELLIFERNQRFATDRPRS